MELSLKRSTDQLLGPTGLTGACGKTRRGPSVRRLGPRAAGLLLALCAQACLSGGGSELQAASSEPTPGRTMVRLELQQGAIEIELYPEAAPESVARLVRVLEQLGDPKTSLPTLSFDEVWPRIEIATSVVRDADQEPMEAMPQEISAKALGLDSRLVANEGEAMNIWQFELSKQDARWKASGQRPPIYEQWLASFAESGNANVLVGLSRQAINEVLGYRYVEGPESRLPRRGAVYLKPLSKTENLLSLVILLNDRPQLDGRVTVVGAVRSGLELAEAISIVEVLQKYGKPSKRPVEPLKINRIQVFYEKQ